MAYISKEELRGDLIMSGIPELSRFADYYSSEIIRKHGDGENLIEINEANKILRNLKISSKVFEKYRPKTIFDKACFTPDELVSFIDWRLNYIKEKYAPYGLSLPFHSLEDAHSWLREEGLKGVLKIERMHCPALENCDPCNRDVYLGSMINMPYRKRTNNTGLTVIDSIICNYSSFLIELNYAVNGLKDLTGIGEIEILDYFLCDKRIEIPRIKGTVAADAFNQYITIQINTNDVTKTEWDEIYDMYRISTNRKHKKKLSEDNMRLAKILDTIEIPEYPNAEFYRQLITKWNNETGENMEISNWRTMRRRYKTVMDYKDGMSAFNNPIMSILNEVKKED